MHLIRFSTEKRQISSDFSHVASEGIFSLTRHYRQKESEQHDQPQRRIHFPLQPPADLRRCRGTPPGQHPHCPADHPVIPHINIGTGKKNEHLRITEEMQQKYLDERIIMPSQPRPSSRNPQAITRIRAASDGKITRRSLK